MPKQNETAPLSKPASGARPPAPTVTRPMSAKQPQGMAHRAPRIARMGQPDRKGPSGNR